MEEKIRIVKACTAPVKCDLCKEAAFIPLPSKQPPPGWQVVVVHRSEIEMAVSAAVQWIDIEEAVLLICPFCATVARALQAADAKLGVAK